MIELVAGVDEAGRGPLAGPVVAAAVILDPQAMPAGIRDSKKLSAAMRERLAPLIQHRARAFAVAVVSASEIDDMNIFQASLHAMRQALWALQPLPERALIDGPHCPAELPCPAEGIVRGDLTVPLISAASIIAKVARDRILCELDARYPDYGFARNKGYPTPQHLAALRRFGPCPEHRRSYRPVQAVLTAGAS